MSDEPPLGLADVRIDPGMTAVLPRRRGFREDLRFPGSDPSTRPPSRPMVKGRERERCPFPAAEAVPARWPPAEPARRHRRPADRRGRGRDPGPDPRGVAKAPEA